MKAIQIYSSLVLISALMPCICGIASADTDYVVKSVSERKVLATRVAAGESYSESYQKLEDYCKEHSGVTPNGPRMDLGSDKENWAAVPVAGDIDADDVIEELDLPSATVASIVYRGRAPGLRKAVSGLISELQAAGYELDIKGKKLRFVHEEAPSAAEMTTEIQIPLRGK